MQAHRQNLDNTIILSISSMLFSVFISNPYSRLAQFPEFNGTTHAIIYLLMNLPSFIGFHFEFERQDPLFRVASKYFPIQFFKTSYL